MPKSARPAHPSTATPPPDPALADVGSGAHDPLVDPPAPPAAPTLAAVAQVSDTVDVTKFLPAGNESGLVAVILAALAIGGVAVKFLPNFLKTRAEKAQLDHEQRMKELELQADNQKRDDDREEKCSSRHAELAGKVAALEARVADAEARAARAEEAAAKAGEKGLEIDADDVSDKLETFSKRITKLETAAKKKGAKS